MADVAQTSPELLALQERIRTLDELKERVQKLRKIPALLLRPPTGNSVAISPISQSAPLHNVSSSLLQEIEQLKDATATLRSEKVQEALAFARDSEQKDKTDLNLTKQRENRKRRRAPSPESPRPYTSFQPQRSSLSPSKDPPPPVLLGGLFDYIKEYNRENDGLRLQVVSSSPRRTLQCPVLIRLIVRDVTTIFLTLDAVENANLTVESTTAFGPREQKPHHSHSDFLVYQKLSQEIMKMIQSDPQVSLRTVMDLLSSYRNLFVQRCISCERILSADAHIPPVARVWSEHGSEGSSPGWEPWHPTCVRR